MWNHTVTFVVGVVTGMFIAQRYDVPDVKRFGTKAVSTTMKKLKEWEKKDNGGSNNDGE
jgi:hypothetical protein